MDEPLFTPPSPEAGASGPRRRRRESSGPVVESHAWEDVRAAWDSTKLGGTIVCKSAGAAINLRQRMYRYRGLLQRAQGVTMFDELLLRLERGDHRIRVVTRESGIVEILAEGQEVGGLLVVPNQGT